MLSDWRLFFIFVKFGLDHVLKLVNVVMQQVPIVLFDRTKSQLVIKMFSENSFRTSKFVLKAWSNPCLGSFCCTSGLNSLRLLINEFSVLVRSIPNRRTKQIALILGFWMHFERSVGCNPMSDFSPEYVLLLKGLTSAWYLLFFYSSIDRASIL